MSNAGDDNLESDVRVKLKLDSTQIRDDLRTIRELITTTFEGEDVERGLEGAVEGRGGWRGETEDRLRRQQASAMNVVDFSVSTLGETLEQGYATFESPYGTHPFTAGTQRGRLAKRAFDVMLGGGDRFDTNQMFSEFEKTDPSIASAIRMIIKQQAITQTSPDQLQGMESVLGSAIAKIGTGERGTTKSAFHQAMQDIVSEIAISQGKTVDQEVRIDPDSRKRADIFMSNILRNTGGRRQLVVGEIKTGEAGVDAMEQSVGYIKQAVRKFYDEFGRLPGEGEIKAFITSPRFKRGSQEAFAGEWVDFMSTLRGERKEPSEHLRDYSRWTSFIKTQKLSEVIMESTLTRGSVSEVRDLIRGFMGTSAGGRLYQAIGSSVNPVETEETKKKQEIFSMYLDLLDTDVRDPLGQKNEMMRAGMDQNLVEGFFEAFERGTEGVGHWLLGPEGVAGVEVPTRISQTMSQQQSEGLIARGSKRSKVLKTNFPAVTYKSVLDDMLGAPRGRGKGRKLTDTQKFEHGSLRSDFMMLYGLGPMSDEGEDLVSRAESSQFWGTTYANPRDFKPGMAMKSEMGQRMQLTESEVMRQMSRLGDSGLISGDYDPESMTRWRQAIKTDMKLNYEIVAAQRRIRGFRGDKSATQIENELTESMKEDIGRVRRKVFDRFGHDTEADLTKSQKEVLSSRVSAKRSEILLTGINTYGGLLSFLGETMGRGGLYNLTQAELRSTIPADHGFLKLLGDTYQEAKDTSVTFLQAFKEQIAKEASDPENNFYNIKSMIEDLKFHNEATLNMSIGTHLQVWFPLNTG